MNGSKVCKINWRKPKDGPCITIFPKWALCPLALHLPSESPKSQGSNNLLDFCSYCSQISSSSTSLFPPTTLLFHVLCGVHLLNCGLEKVWTFCPPRAIVSTACLQWDKSESGCPLGNKVLLVYSPVRYRVWLIYLLLITMDFLQIPLISPLDAQPSSSRKHASLSFPSLLTKVSRTMKALLFYIPFNWQINCPSLIGAGRRHKTSVSETKDFIMAIAIECQQFSPHWFPQPHCHSNTKKARRHLHREWMVFQKLFIMGNKHDYLSLWRKISNVLYQTISRPTLCSGGGAVSASQSSPLGKHSCKDRAQ